MLCYISGRADVSCVTQAHADHSARTLFLHHDLGANMLRDSRDPNEFMVREQANQLVLNSKHWQLLKFQILQRW